ncbi:MAG: hypothetical protein ACP5TV_11820, partial [Anaerolineae bacterium]
MARQDSRWSTRRLIGVLATACLVIAALAWLIWRAYPRAAPPAETTAVPAADHYAEERANMVKFQLMGRDIT